VVVVPVVEVLLPDLARTGMAPAHTTLYCCNTGGVVLVFPVCCFNEDVDDMRGAFPPLSFFPTSFVVRLILLVVGGGAAAVAVVLALSPPLPAFCTHLVLPPAATVLPIVVVVGGGGVVVGVVVVASRSLEEIVNGSPLGI